MSKQEITLRDNNKMEKTMIDMNKEIELQLYYLDLGSKLKYYRERMNVSLEAAAGCLGIHQEGKKVEDLIKIENGNITSLTDVERLCVYYNIPFSVIIRRSYNDKKR